MAEFYDISLDFSLNSTGDIALVEDNSAIVQSLRNIISTTSGGKTGEGFINEDYGVGINEYLFAPLTSFVGQSLGEAILRKINVYEPRINVEDLRITVNRSKRRFEIEIDYFLIRSGREFTFKTVINQI